MGTQPRVAVAGSTGTTDRTIERLLAHDARIVGILGLSPTSASNVSDYRDLRSASRRASTEYAEFVDINAPQTLDTVRSWKPDVLFVVGLSQLVGDLLLGLPRLGCVGFHPTRLPLGRGRAPVAWIILDDVPAAATFFVLERRVDSGAVLVQEPFSVGPDDHADDVYRSMDQAIRRALDHWLPRLTAGEWDPVPQDEHRATWYRERIPADGFIDWTQPSEGIVRLIRATSRPYPGAFSFLGSRRLIAWRARVVEHPRVRGVPGQVLQVIERERAVVQAGSGAVVLLEARFADAGDTQRPALLRVGDRLDTAMDSLLSLRQRANASEAERGPASEEVP